MESPLSVSTLLLLVLTLTAAASDLWTGKIFNWNTYPGIVVGLVVNWLEQGWDGPRGLEDSLKGLALCGGLMLVSFVLFNVGGGDVKLMAMLGAFLGVEQGLETLLWTFVLGAMFALVRLVWKVGAWRLISGIFRHVMWSLKLGSWLPLSEAERRELQPSLHLAPAALAGVGIVVFGMV